MQVSCTPFLNNLVSFGNVFLFLSEATVWVEKIVSAERVNESFGYYLSRCFPLNLVQTVFDKTLQQTFELDLKVINKKCLAK